MFSLVNCFSPVNFSSYKYFLYLLSCYDYWYVSLIGYCSFERSVNYFALYFVKLACTQTVCAKVPLNHSMVRLKMQ